MADCQNDSSSTINGGGPRDFASLLASANRDYLIRNNGSQIPVSDLVGKIVLLYFSAHWCPSCRAFLPELIDAYHKIKVKHDAFEVVFISSDRDQTSFDEFFSGMPWLALPFGDGDGRNASLTRAFKVRGMPMLVALGPTGRTVTKAARELITTHGADAYPFTDERMKEIEAEHDEMKKGWPEKVKHALHEDHELVLIRRMVYNCDGCKEEGNIWSFYCEECDFNLHPECALAEGEGTKTEEEEEEEENPKEGNGSHGRKVGYVCDERGCREAWVCYGRDCYKA